MTNKEKKIFVLQETKDIDEILEENEETWKSLERAEPKVRELNSLLDRAHQLIMDIDNDIGGPLCWRVFKGKPKEQEK